MNSNFKPEMNGMNSGSDKCIRINSQEYENPLTKCIQKGKNAKWWGKHAYKCETGNHDGISSKEIRYFDNK